MPVLFRILLLLAGLVPFCLSAAEIHDPFLVRNLVQDIHDSNLVQARNQALLLGQLGSFGVGRQEDLERCAVADLDKELARGAEA